MKPCILDITSTTLEPGCFSWLLLTAVSNPRAHLPGQHALKTCVLTKDHKPEDPDETQLIQSLGKPTFTVIECFCPPVLLLGECGCNSIHVIQQRKVL